MDLTAFKLTEEYEQLREVASGLLREMLLVGQRCYGILHERDRTPQRDVRRVNLLLGDVHQGTVDACPSCRYEYDRLKYQIEPAVS